MPFVMWTRAAAVKINVAESIMYGLMAMSFGVALAARESVPDAILLLPASVVAAFVGWIAVGPWITDVADRLRRNLEVRLNPMDRDFLWTYIPLPVLLLAETLLSILGHLSNPFVYSVPFLSAGAYVAASKLRVASEFRKTEKTLGRKIIVVVTDSGPHRLVFHAES